MVGDRGIAFSAQGLTINARNLIPLQPGATEIGCIEQAVGLMMDPRLRSPPRLPSFDYLIVKAIRSRSLCFVAVKLFHGLYVLVASLSIKELVVGLLDPFRLLLGGIFRGILNPMFAVLDLGGRCNPSLHTNAFLNHSTGHDFRSYITN